LVVSAKGYSTREATFGADAVKADVELHPLARISGRLSDRETGEAVNVVLSLRRTGRNGGGDKLTDNDGKFEFADLEPGDYTLRLRQDGDAIPGWKPEKPRHSYGPAVYPETIHLEEGARRAVDFRLAALEGHSVSGNIEIPAGREKDLITFTLWHLGVALPTVSQAKVSGAFRIDGLTRGDYGLIAEMGKGSDLLFARQSFSVTDHDIGSVNLKLSQPAGITGTVRMAEEDAALPAKLEVWLNSTSGWGSCGGYCLVMQSKSLLATDGLVRIFQRPIPVVGGRFQAEGVAPDEYWPELFDSDSTGRGLPTLNELPDGYAVLKGNEQPIPLYGGAHVDFVLTSKPGIIAGVVQDSQQAPVAGATVTLIPAWGSRRQAAVKSGAAGEFTFKNLAPGKYRVNGVLTEVGFGQRISVVVGQ
jgi:hypothetical protein